MKLKVNLLWSIVLLLLACSSNPKTDVSGDKNQSANLAFGQLLDNYYEEGLQLFPLKATKEGDPRYNHSFPNILSDEYRNELKEYYSGYLEMVSQFDDNELSESEAMSKAVLEWECEINLEGLAFRQDLFPIDQMWSVNLVMGQFAGGESAQPFETVEDYYRWLERLEGYLVWMESAKEKMEEGIKLGYVLPKSLIVKVLPTLEAMTVEDPDKNLFYSPVRNFPETFTVSEKEILREAYHEMITGRIIPSYKSLHQFMSTEYLQAGRETSGIDAIPQGKAYYEHQIKSMTTTYMTSDEIYRLGVNEVERILEEMEKVKSQVGFKGDLKSFFEYIRTSYKFMPFTDPQQVIDHFNAIHERIKPQVERLFDLKPGAAFEVKRTEAFREKSSSAEYNPGSVDGTRPGVFYVPIPDVTRYNLISDETLFLHEAIPGHHFQMSITQESEELPKFRKTLWYSGYGEGWALYTESLGSELGLFTDPYQYFGMLAAEMHRAIRLVVDVGLHAGGWTREEAIQYSMEHEPMSKSKIISEVERYMANPGQALSYKIGQLKIRELRTKAEETLGDQFEIREFHNLVLETGCIPLALLENKIENWIGSF